MNARRKDLKKCPWCAEEIRVEAVICRFCRNVVNENGIQLARQVANGEAPLPPQPTSSEISDVKTKPNLIEQIIAIGETIDEGERRSVAVLFSDIVGFTSLTSEIGAERMNELLDQIFTEVRDITGYYGGVVEKFIGDAVMAVFGAPESHGDDAERAIRAALDIRKAIRKIGEDEGLTLDTHSGIAYGEVIFTAHGDADKLEFRAVGNPVNLAARLQASANVGETLVDHRTFRQTETTFKFQALKPLQVKGRKQNVVPYRVTGVVKRFAKENLGERISMVPLVGRRSELELLIMTEKKVLAGHSGVVVLEGEAGIGKSRLIYEFYHRLDKHKWNWFTSRCESYGKHTPFLPFVELFRAFLCPLRKDRLKITARSLPKLVARIYDPALRRTRSAGSKQELRRCREQAGQALAILFGLPYRNNPLLKLPARERRLALLESFRELIRRVSQEKPAVLVFEDFQWSDQDSCELLHDLAAQLKRSPVLFLVCKRPKLPEQFEIKPEFLHIELEELSPRNTEELLRRILGIERLPRELRDKVLEKTEGNPFYVEEVLLNLEERGVLERRAGTYILKQPLEAIEIPDTIEGLVIARLDRLERKVRTVLQCASVIGQEFRHNVLSQVTEIGERLQRHMYELIEGDYVFKQNLIAELVYVFRHIVLRDVAYNSLLEKRRRHYHTKIGEAIELLFTQNLEEHIELLAHHFRLGEKWERAIPYLEASALKCERLYSNHAAIEWWNDYLRALTLWEAKQGPAAARANRERRLRALLHLGELYRLTGQAAAGAGMYQQAVAQARALNHTEDCARAWMGLGEALRLQGELGQGLNCLKQARRGAQRGRNPVLLAACNNLCGHFEISRGNWKQAGRYFQQMLQSAGRHGDRLARYQALNHLGIVQMYAGRNASAESCFREAQELALELGRRGEWLQIELNLGILEAKRGTCGAARARYMSVAVESEKLELEWGLQLAQLALADLDLKQGDFRAAKRRCEELLERLKQAGSEEVRAVTLGNLARAQLGLEKFGNAEAALAEAERIVRKDGNYVGLIDAYLIRSELLLAQGKGRQALAPVREGLKLAQGRSETEHLAALQLLLARAQLKTDKPADALLSARGALRSARRSGALRDEGWSRWVLGLCLERQQRPRDARPHFDKALSLARQVNDNALQKMLAGAAQRAQ